MAQKRIQRTRSKISASARYETWDAQDAATERALSDALKASKRARNLLRKLDTV